MTKFPSAFTDQIKAKLGNESDAFFEALHSSPKTSIITNRNKPRPSLLENANEVPWCPGAFYLAERPQFVFDPEFHAGSYYVMEASSMMLWQALDQVLDSEKPLRILDLCGAPGGKSMVIANFMNEDSILVSNEVHRGRYQVLKENTAKWGMPNVFTSSYDPSNIKMNDFFDCVVVDAPCSGEGLFRKTPDAVDEWSIGNVNLCAKRQQRILHEAARMVKPGGYLIYSTCTYNDIENINNTVYLSNNQEFDTVKLNLDFNIFEVKKNACFGYHCFPHRMDGEGFFIAALQKSGSALPPKKKKFNRKNKSLTHASKHATSKWQEYLNEASSFEIFQHSSGIYYAVKKSIHEAYCKLQQELPHIQGTLLLGEIKREDIVPHHNLALSTFVNPSVPVIELTLDQAKSYLRKDQVQLESANLGWCIVSYQGHHLGWVKQTIRQTKNYFPTNLRVRKRE